VHHARSAVEGSRRSVLENGLTGQVKYCEDFCGFPNFLGLRSNVESPDRYAGRIAKVIRFFRTADRANLQRNSAPRLLGTLPAYFLLSCGGSYWRYDAGR